jgi:integrase
MVTHGADYIRSRSKNPNTVKRYFSCWKERVGPYFGSYKFNELTPAIVQAGLTQGLSGATQELDKAVLNHIIKSAIIVGKCEERVRFYLEIAVLMPRARKKRVGMVSKMDKIFELCKLAGSWMEGPVFAMMYLGPRKAEICGLKRTDIDTNSGLIRIHTQRNHTTGEREGLKNHDDERLIGLPVHFAKQLVAYHRPNTIYLFTRPDNSTIPYQHLDREIKRVIRDFHPDPEGEEATALKAMTIHDYRAAAVNRLRADSKSKEQISEIMGWRDPNTINKYWDVDTSRTRDTMSSVVPGG